MSNNEGFLLSVIIAKTSTFDIQSSTFFWIALLISEEWLNSYKNLL
jgi:hypothetical protein